jgi:tetratricopeptide (TPR) repeat protein
MMIGQRMGPSSDKGPKTRLRLSNGATGLNDLQILFDNAVKHQSAGRFAEAINIYNSILALEPNLPEVYSNVGALLATVGRLEDAQLAYQRAISLKPGFAEAYHNLSMALKDLGRLTEACQYAERAIQLAPKEASYYRNLATLRPFVTEDPYLVGLEALAKEVSLGVQDQIHMHFTLAKAYEDIGLFERAFQQLLAGNANKRQRSGYDETSILGGISAVEAVFTPELIQARRGFGDPSQVPIFIVGMPRSGTTLIEQILASHPQVFGAGELRLLDQAVARIGKALPGMPPYPEMVPVMSGEHIRTLGTLYIHELLKLAPSATRITDKMPTNFFFAGLIHLALPNAIIINASRCSIDTCLSCFFTQFEGPQPFDDLAELGRYYRHYQSLMAHWRQVLPPGRILDVRYEDLVTDLNNAAQGIVAHCGLDWDARCLDFHLTKRAVRTPSATQVRKPIYKSSVGRWRKYKPFLAALLAELEPSINSVDDRARGANNKGMS